MTEGVPSLTLSWDQLKRLAEKLLSLFGVLGQEVESATSEIKQLCLLLLVLDQVDGFGVQKGGRGVKDFANFPDAVLTEVRTI